MMGRIFEIILGFLAAVGKVFLFFLRPVLPFVEAFFTRHAGLTLSLVAVGFTWTLFVGGSLRGFDDYLTAVVYQIGFHPPKMDYQPGEPRPLEEIRNILVIKKDEKTSALLAANPGRREFASIIRLLGNPRTESVKDVMSAGADLVRRFKFAELKIGLLKCGKDGAFSLPLLKYAGSEATKDDPTPFKCSESLARLFGEFFELSPELLASAASHMGKPMEAWPREVFSQGTGFLRNLLGASLALNIRVFPKPDTVFQIAFQMVIDYSQKYEIPPARIIGLDFLLQGTKTVEEDAMLVDAIASSEAPVILAAQVERQVQVQQMAEIKSNASGTSEEIMENQVETIEVLPNPMFLKDSTHLAFINVSPDNKGYLSRIPLFVKIPQAQVLKPSFSLSIAAMALDRNSSAPQELNYEKAMWAELERIKPAVFAGSFKGGFNLLDRHIPVDSYGNMHLYFMGSSHPRKGDVGAPILPALSFYECFDDEVLAYHAGQRSPPPPEFTPEKAHFRSCQKNSNFGNKICLVGPFERSDFDFFPTPMSMATPFQIHQEMLMGVEIHANAIANILTGKYLAPPNEIITSILLLISTGLLGALLDFMSPMVGLFTTVSFILGIFGYAFYSYNFLAKIVLFSPMVLSFPLTWAMTNFLNFIRQRKKAAATKQLFQRFVSPEVVQYLIDNPDEVKPGGQKVEMSIFFSDLAGFTTISEALTPEKLVELMNEYLGEMTEILFKHEGTLDKYIGDAVMAYWNFPRKQDNHALLACLYCIRMQQRLLELQQSWAKRGLPKAYARAGINTSKVVVGCMGSAKAQMNFTCLGDGVNLASRLEGANKEYGTLFMISDATYQQAKEGIAARFLDFLAVKGKTEPVKVYELVSEKGKEPPGFFEMVALYDKAILLHNDRKWDEAIATFETILTTFPDDGPSKTYLKRCQEYKENPPPDKWDLSYHLTHK